MARREGGDIAIPNDLLLYHLCHALNLSPEEVRAMHQEALVMWEYAEGRELGLQARRELEAAQARGAGGLR